MSHDCDYSLVIWDGKSSGSHKNILRAIEHGKKVKIFYEPSEDYLDSKKINKMEIDYLFRKNNGYTAKEVVEHLISEGEEFFRNTRMLNKYLLEHNIIIKEDGIYKPTQEHIDLFIIDKYRGKTKGIKFKNEFINWVEEWIKNIKPPEQQSII